MVQCATDPESITIAAYAPVATERSCVQAIMQNLKYPYFTCKVNSCLCAADIAPDVSSYITSLGNGFCTSSPVPISHAASIYDDYCRDYSAHLPMATITPSANTPTLTTTGSGSQGTVRVTVTVAAGTVTLVPTQRPSSATMCTMPPAWVLQVLAFFSFWGFFL